MADAALVYRGTVQLADADRGLYTELRIATALHPSETPERLAARILAYCLHHEPDIAFTKGICDGDTPDLWVLEPGGGIACWVEVGLPSAERLLKAARRARQVVLYAYGPVLHHWERQELPRLKKAANLVVHLIDMAFLEEVAALLERGFAWTLTVADGVLYLDIGGRLLQTELRRLTADESSPDRRLIH